MSRGLVSCDESVVKFGALGVLRFFDVLAFRIYYRLALAGSDSAWTRATLNDLFQRYADIPDIVPCPRHLKSK